MGKSTSQGSFTDHRLTFSMEVPRFLCCWWEWLFNVLHFAGWTWAKLCLPQIRVMLPCLCLIFIFKCSVQNKLWARSSWDHSILCQKIVPPTLFHPIFHLAFTLDAWLDSIPLKISCIYPPRNGICKQILLYNELRLAVPYWGVADECSLIEKQ